MFKNRKDAGQKLAEKREKYQKIKNGVVVAIPRGGVVTGYEISKKLSLPLEVVVTKKIGAPGNPEYAIGSINRHGDIFINEQLNISKDYIDQESIKLKQQIKKKLKKLKGNDQQMDFKDKIVILTDDGIATGYTMLAAIKFIKSEKPKKIILAIPVVPADNVDKFRGLVDEFIYLEIPVLFAAVGQFYEQFGQTTDEEAKELLHNYI